MTIEERARIEITSYLASVSRINERFKNGDVDGHWDHNNVEYAVFNQDTMDFLECGPFEQRHLMLWQLQLRRVKLDVAVNVIPTCQEAHRFGGMRRRRV